MPKRCACVSMAATVPRILFFVLCAALLATPAAFAQQTYPQKPIRYIVPFPAGGIADVFARIIGGRIAEAWGQPVVVENRAGVGTTSHLACELFKSMARVDITHVPYKGNVPAITDLLGGQTSMLFATMPTVLPHVKAGKLKGIAVLGTGRSPAAPEIPALAEALPGFEVNNWVGTFGPAGMPAAIAAKLNSEILAVMRTPDVQQRLLTEGARFTPMTPSQFSAFVAAETAKWGKLIREIGIRAD